MSRWIVLVTLVIPLLAACQVPTGVPTPAPTPEPGVLATPRSREAQVRDVPALATHEAMLQSALQGEPPVLQLADTLADDGARRAEALALADPAFLEFVRDPDSNAPLRNEIMGVRPALPSDLPADTDGCPQGECYRVEMYNYALNAATIAIVDAARGEVLAIDHHPNAQPDIPQRLIDVAVDIAARAPEVQEALGVEPGGDDAVMPNVKTALNGTRCERSSHLCVAPTFLVDDRALWAIVDLTDGRLVGVRWTNLGESGPPELITERSLQNEYVMKNFCEQTNSLEQDGWALDYVITPSDGLEVSDLRFEGQPVMRSAKLVDWHVSYSRVEGFGYSDAAGCPMFSSAGAVAFEGPTVEPIEVDGRQVGFALVQDFRSPVWPAPCNYRYEQRYEFYDDGRFRVAAANLGRGCGDDGTYRPVLRIDLTASADGRDTFAEWDGEGWVPWEVEGWQLQDEETPFTAEGFQYRLAGPDGTGFYLEPGQGQFGDGGRGDNAFVYVTAREPGRDEGDAELVTIGSCCNTDYQQGPEQFLEPAEPIAERDLVIWYVAQQENDATPGSEYCWADVVIEDGVPEVKVWPCVIGPMFVPTGSGATP